MKTPAKEPLVLDIGESFDALEAFVEKLETSIEEIVAEQAHAAEGEQWEEGYGEDSYRHVLFEQTLPRTLRYSILLLAYAALDSLLSRLCAHVHKTLAIAFAPSDMNHARGLSTRMEYLCKALALPESAFEAGFSSKLRSLSIARNIVAHAAGELTGTSDQNKRALSQLGFDCSNTYLEMPKGLIPQLLSDARGWAEATCDTVEDALGKLGHGSVGFRTGTINARDSDPEQTKKSS
jgi:hypothetical protein